MRDLSRSVKSATFFLGVVVFLLAGLGAFYYLRTQSNAARLSERNLRELARIGRSIEGRIGSFRTIVPNQVQEAAVPAPGGEAAAPSAGGGPTATKLQGAAQQVPGLRQLQRLKAVHSEPSPPEPDSAPPPAPSPAAPPAGTAAEPSTSTLSPARLTARLDRSRAVLQLKLSDPAGEAPWQGEVELRSILQPFLDSPFFTTLFVADSQGRVFLTGGDEALRLHRIPGGMASGGDGDTSGAAPVPVASAVRGAVVGGEHYELFVQPVRLGLASSEGPGEEVTDWLVGGLVSASRFRSESWALHPTQLLLLSALLLAAVLGWPFLKVWSMGPRERVEVMDVLFMGFSLVLAGGVLALALEDLVFYPGYKAHLDCQLVRMGERLAGNLEGEIADALGQLEVLTREHAGEAGAAEGGRVDLLSSRPAAAWRYPYLEMVFWADADGRQRAKWTVQGRTTPFISVAERGYYRRVREGRLWWAEVDGRSVAYALEPIRSRNTGEELVALSMDYSQALAGAGAGGASPPAREHAGWVAVLLTRLAAVERPVLPPGFGFAVIGPDGRTLFHSQPVRNQEERFFDELDDASLLRSAVAARGSHQLSARYLGREVRLSVRPLEGTPLSLVVIGEKAYLQTANFEALLLALGPFLLYVALVCLLLAGLYLLRPATRLAWAWPDPAHPLKYALLTLLMMLFAATLVLQAIFLDPGLLLPAAFLLPLVALGLAYAILNCGLPGWRMGRRLGWGLAVVATAALVGLIFRFDGSGAALVLALIPLGLLGMGALLAVACHRGAYRSRQWRLPLGRLYVAAMGTSLVVLAMLPAALIFRVVFFDHVKLYVRHGQLEIVRSLSEREVRLGNALAERPEILRRRLAAGVDLAFGPFYDSRLCVDGKPRLEGGAVARRVDLERCLGASGELEESAGLAEECRPLLRRHAPCFRAHGSGWTLQGTAPPCAGEGEGGQARPLEEPRPLWVHEALGDYLPFFNRASVATRRLHAPAAGDGSWHWQAQYEETGVGWWWARRERELRLTAAAGPGVPAFSLQSRLRSAVPSLPPLWWLGCAAAFAGLFALLRFAGRRVFLLGFDGLGTAGLERLVAGPLATHLLILCGAGCRREPLRRRSDFEGVDLQRRAAAGPEAWLPALPPVEEKPVLWIDHAELAWDDAGRSRQLLARLEEEIFLHRRRVILLTDRELAQGQPGGTEPGGGEAGSEAAPTHAEVARRWARLLAGFRRVTADGRSQGEAAAFRGWLATRKAAILAAHSRPDASRPPGFDRRVGRLFAILEAECAGDPTLEAMGRQLLEQADLTRLTPDALLDALRESAEGTYRSRWRALASEEKLLLTQLAQGSLVNPSRRRPLRRLLARGLLVRDPALRLSNESFARFVREEVDPAELEAWGEEEAASTWQRLNRPLLATLLVVAVFLFATQRNLFDTTMGFVSTITVGLPALLKLLGMLRRGGSPDGG